MPQLYFALCASHPNVNWEEREHESILTCQKTWFQNEDIKTLDYTIPNLQEEEELNLQKEELENFSCTKAYENKPLNKIVKW